MYHFAYSLDGGKQYLPFAETPSNLLVCHGYTGNYLGLYASSNGNPLTGYADFDWVSYEGFQKL